MSTSPTKLTPRQSHALFNLLTHEQAQYEFQSLKVPGRIAASGPPFVPEPALPTQRPSPILSVLFRKLMLTLPGFRDAKTELWSEHVQTVLEDMAAQDLSDSYDKGSISKRKTCGYAVAVVAEYAARGALGGMPTFGVPPKDTYNVNSVEDVMSAWDSLREGFVYGNAMEELVEWAVKTDKLEDLPTRLQAAHKFASVTFASFLHYLFTLNAAGPTILRLIKRIHALLPYGLVRQALRIGNAATFTNAVLKIFLYRAPTFRGFFKGGKDSRGTNLLQSVISSVLGADKTALQRKFSTLKGGTPAQMAAIDEYVNQATRDDRLSLREESEKKPTSLVSAILESEGVDLPATDADHAALQDRLSLGLAIRDRDRLVQVLSGQARRPVYGLSKSSQQASSDRGVSPTASTSSLNSTKSGPSMVGLDDLGLDSSDHLSAGIREVGRAFDEVLRHVHRAGDLPRALGDLQAFIDAILAIPLGAGVNAYIDVVAVHQKSLHRFLHSVAQDKELCRWYMEWYRTALDAYRTPEPQSEGAAGAMTPDLEQLVANLTDEDRNTVLSEVDAYALHLEKLQQHSRERMLSALKGRSDSKAGPGIWLATWQGMVDRTAVTPAGPNAPVRYGADNGIQQASAADGAEGADDAESTVARKSQENSHVKASVGAQLGLAGNAMPATTRTWSLLKTSWEDLLVEKCSR